jgi:hypothetical protein
MNLIDMGRGSDNEPVKLQKIHEACWLVHCEGNNQSPFEFMTLKDALQFISTIRQGEQ